MIGNSLAHCRPISDCDLCADADYYCSFTATGEALCCSAKGDAGDLESVMEQEVEATIQHKTGHEDAVREQSACALQCPFCHISSYLALYCHRIIL